MTINWPLALWGTFTQSTPDGDYPVSWRSLVKQTGETLGSRMFDVDIICMGFWTCPVSLSREVAIDDVRLWIEICETVAKMMVLR